MLLPILDELLQNKKEVIISGLGAVLNDNNVKVRILHFQKNLSILCRIGNFATSLRSYGIFRLLPKVFFYVTIS